MSALYVVCFHAATVVPAENLSLPILAFRHLFLYGHFAVVIFIVLSGYCLMLPVVASETRTLRGGLRQFVVRRAKRILPPYYAALLLSIPIHLFYLHLKKLSFSMPSLIAHLLLVHNLNSSWYGDINGVLWTVATEWQIYFVFAVALLPLYRKGGIVLVIITASVLGYGVYLSGAGRHLYQAAYWYLAIFSVGMAGASLSLGFDKQRQSASRRITPLIVGVCLMGCVVAYLPFLHWTWRETIALDTIVGIAAVSMIVYCAQAEGSMVTRALSLSPLHNLGIFSYSLYLIHFPVISVMDWCFKRLVHSDNELFIFQFLAAVPVSIVAAYIFFHVCERPFLSAGARWKVRIASSALAS